MVPTLGSGLPRTKLYPHFVSYVHQDLQASQARRDLPAILEGKEYEVLMEFPGCLVNRERLGRQVMLGHAVGVENLG